MSGEDAKHSNPAQKGETARRDAPSRAPSPGCAPSRAGCPHSPLPNLLPGPPNAEGRSGTAEGERVQPTRGAPGARSRCPPVTGASTASLCPAARPHGPAHTCSSGPRSGFPYRQTLVVGKTLPKRSCGWQRSEPRGYGAVSGGDFCSLGSCPCSPASRPHPRPLPPRLPRSAGPRSGDPGALVSAPRQPRRAERRSGF